MFVFTCVWCALGCSFQLGTLFLWWESMVLVLTLEFLLYSARHPQVSLASQKFTPFSSVTPTPSQIGPHHKAGGTQHLRPIPVGLCRGAAGAMALSSVSLFLFSICKKMRGGVLSLLLSTKMVFVQMFCKLKLDLQSHNHTQSHLEPCSATEYIVIMCAICVRPMHFPRCL